MKSCGSCRRLVFAPMIWLVIATTCRLTSTLHDVCTRCRRPIREQQHTAILGSAVRRRAFRGSWDGYEEISRWPRAVGGIGARLQPRLQPRLQTLAERCPRGWPRHIVQELPAT